MGILGAAHGWGGKNNLSHISYNDETWHSYSLPKEDSKTISVTWHTPWVSLTSPFYLGKSANLINLVIILMMSAKMAAQAFLK